MRSARAPLSIIATLLLGGCPHPINPPAQVCTTPTLPDDSTVGSEGACPVEVRPIPDGLLPAPRDAAAVAFGFHDVIGADDRRRVTDVMTAPYRAICELRITAPNGMPLVCTGFLIGPTTILTAGHCVHIQSAGGWMRSIEVIPALDGTTRPFQSIVSTTFRSVAAWTQSQRRTHDYGVVILPAPFAQPPPVALRVVDDAALARASVTIGGYPIDHGSNQQWIHTRQVTRLDALNLYYDIDTYPGQSGSPIWYVGGDGVPVAVGIHTTGGEMQNAGTRITPAMIANLQAWIAGR